MPDESVDLHDVAGRLAIAIGRINRRIRPATDGLSHGLISALSTIVRTGPTRPSDVARAEVVAPPTMTRAIADLEARGLVERAPDPADGRSYLISATESGRAAVLRARSERAHRVEALLEGRSPAEIALLIDALPVLEATAGATVGIALES